MPQVSRDGRGSEPVDVFIDLLRRWQEKGLGAAGRGLGGASDKTGMGEGDMAAGTWLAGGG